MKEFWKKLAGAKAFWIGLIILVQTVAYVAAGMGKAYMHMDEAYSYGSANYSKLEILDEENFNNRWHPAEFYRAYLVADWYERWDFEPVYNNQRDDVHPPLFHLFLRLMMELTPGEFTLWTGMTLNIIVFAVNTVFLYLVVWRLLADSTAGSTVSAEAVKAAVGSGSEGKAALTTGSEERTRLVKAAALTLAASVTMAALSTVVYVRMYAMLTMWVTITAYLHLRLMTAKKVEPKLLAAIAAVAALGVLTQYYYLFFLVPMFGVMMVRYFRAKDWKKMRAYVVTLVVAAGVSLLIWPWSIKHLFFGYRGQGAISNLLNFAQLGEQLAFFAGLITLYDFHYMLPVILIAMFGLAIWALRRGKKLEVGRQEGEAYGLLLWPTLVYFVIVAVASPYVELRYVEAICPLLFVVAMWGLYKLAGMVCSEKRRNVVMAVVLGVTAILPVPLRLEPDVEYSAWATATEFVEEHKSIPLLYIYDRENNNRFLDDILLFATADWSYIMTEQLEVTESSGQSELGYAAEDFRKVLETRDLEEGLIVMANYGYGNQKYLDTLKEATGLTEQEYVFRLNAADLYYLHK